MGQVAAEASPAAVMDLSFANQALCTRYLLQAHQQLAPAVYDVPSEIDERVAQVVGRHQHLAVVQRAAVAG